MAICGFSESVVLLRSWLSSRFLADLGLSVPRIRVHSCPFVFIRGSANLAFQWAADEYLCLRFRILEGFGNNVLLGETGHEDFAVS